MMEARALLGALPEQRLVGSLPAAFSAVTADSRTAAPGTLFIALHGLASDGHAFAAAAARAGATAVVVDHELPLEGVAQVVVPDTRRAASRLADRFYATPSRALAVAGVTGTNGKTTTTYLAAAALDAAGIHCGIVGTLGAYLGERTWPLANTTPLALELHAVLAQLRDAGAAAVAMEVSSHALVLGRVDDVCFSVAALTNVTRDHLDFHATFADYAAAKRRLFDLAPSAVINISDPVGARLAADRGREGLGTITYAQSGLADLVPSDLVLRADGSSFAIGEIRVDLALPGRFNVANALAALGIARALGVDLATAARGIASVDAVPGRMERIAAGGVTVVVDYAHTPDALGNVLRAAREATAHELIVVFGAGGDRDPGKRPQMGAVAREYADRTIVTSDNPRSEDPAAIAAAVAGGKLEIVLDRRTAIRTAIADARDGDTVVIAGKGHETYQIVGDRVLPFDDREEARAALARRTAAAQ